MSTITKQDDFLYDVVFFITEFPGYLGQCAWMRGFPKIVFPPVNDAEPACQARGSGVPGDLSGNRHGIIIMPGNCSE
ncbi:MAG: hypothetical protein ACXWTY_02865 [Methylobacter sp.]